VAYFYAAAAPRSRGALWPIFTPALILWKDRGHGGAHPVESS
jgi:hypothetical protein